MLQLRQKRDLLGAVSETAAEKKHSEEGLKWRNSEREEQCWKAWEEVQAMKRLTLRRQAGGRVAVWNFTVADRLMARTKGKGSIDWW